MKLRIRILPIIGLLLLMILYAPASVPGTAPCSQLASGAKYGFLGFLVPSVAACPGPEFTVTANPSSLAINPAAPGTSTIVITSLYSFSGTVSLSTSPPPLCPSPNCSTWSINPMSVTLSPNGTASSSFTVTAGTSSPTPGNWVNVTVFGTSGNLTRSAIVKFTTSSTPDFSITANPASLQVQTGTTSTSTVAVTSLNGFAGNVSLQVPPSPLCPACTGWAINPWTVTLSPNGTATSTLTIYAGGNPTSGSVTVNATSGNLSHTVTVNYTIVSKSSYF